MSDRELLFEISLMLNPIREKINDMSNDIDHMKADIDSMKADISDIKKRVTNIELTQENVILPRLNTIEACYTSTYYRYKEQVETYESMKQDISILKSIVAEHSEKLRKIS